MVDGFSSCLTSPRVSSAPILCFWLVTNPARRGLASVPRSGQTERSCTPGRTHSLFAALQIPQAASEAE